MHFALQVGLMLKYGQKTLELVREFGVNEFQFEEVLTRRPITFKRAELINGIYDKKYEVLKNNFSINAAEVSDDRNKIFDISNINEKEKEKLDMRLAYVKYIQKLKISRGQREKIDKAVKDFALLRSEKKPSTSSVMLWIRKFHDSEMNPFSLIDKYRGKSRSYKFSVSVDDVVWRVLRKFYFTKDRHSAKFAYEKLTIELKRCVKQGELKEEEAKFSISTFYRRIKSTDQYYKIEKREGPARARMVCRTAFPDGVAEYPYQRVEIDHTPLNWVVICDRTGLPLGRPTLTIMIDAYSGYILGFYLSFYGAGLTSVCGVVKNSLMPKEDLIDGLDLKYNWLACGLGDEWVIDNGLEFHSYGFKNMAMTLGVDLTYSKVRTPWVKPHVERFFSTLNTITLTKGRVSKTVANIVKVDPYRDAAINFTDLVKGLMAFIVDVHPHQPNWRKMSTPYELFSEGIEKSPPVLFPGNLDQLRLASGMSKNLTLNHGGIELLGLPYGSYAFKDLIRKYGSKLKLQCKWDPDDMSSIKVLDPDGITWHDAICRWKEYSNGLSLNQHQLIRKFAKIDLKKSGKLDDLIDSKQRLHEHWLNATSTRNKSSSLLAGRFADLTSHKVLTNSPADSLSEANNEKILISPIEFSIKQKDIPSFDSVIF